MRRVLGLFVCTLLVASMSDAQRLTKSGEGGGDFINGIVGGLTQAIDDKADELTPVVEKQAQSIWNQVQAEVDKGFVHLDSLTNEVNSMVANLEKNLANALNSEDMVKVRTMLESIDGNAMDAVVEALAEKGVEAMNVSTEKIDEVKALLAKEIKSRGALLDKYLDQGKAGLEAFDKESKELFNGTVAELKNLVSDEDLQKLKTRFNDTDKKIQQLFSATQ